MTLSAINLDFKTLNEQVKAAGKAVEITNCCGQRFIGSGLADKQITIHGTPGNGLGAYLNGGHITVHGNVQDAVGDTMNGGTVVVHGSAGDALGYAMRGGNIYVQGSAGYRTGIHMKQYGDKIPAVIVGGSAGSFLGEYLAGGLIIVLGLDGADFPVGGFTGTGMHGGRIFIRTEKEPRHLPEQVSVKKAEAEDLAEIKPYLEAFSGFFGTDLDNLINAAYYLLTPNAKNPYKQLYTAN